jgi:hypothetical protein
MKLCFKMKFLDELKSFVDLISFFVGNFECMHNFASFTHLYSTTKTTKVYLKRNTSQ